MAINPLQEYKRRDGQKSCQIWGLTAGSLEEPFYFCGLDLSKWSLTISIVLGVLSPVAEPGGVTPFLRVPPVPVPSSGPPPLSLSSLEQSLLAWWSNPASEHPPVLLCHQIIRYFSTSRGHCGLPYARSSAVLRRQQPRSVAAWQRWHKPVVVPSRPGWEGAWAAVRGTCPSSPALSCSVLQTHETLLASAAGQGEAGTPK